MKKNFSLSFAGWLGLFALLPLALSSAPPPVLSIRAAGNGQINLSWPAAAVGYALEQADAFGHVTVWQPVATLPTTQGNEFSVTLPGNAGNKFFRLRQVLTSVRASSPVNGETGVAVTRETIVHFSSPLSSNAIVTTNNFYAGFGGRRILSRVELSSDRTKASLFYLEPMPGSTRVVAVFDGTGLTDFMGWPLDADGDGVAGGSEIIAFDTLNLTALAGTAVIGTVYASELVSGNDTGTNAVNKPLAGVTITVDGQEQTLRTVTDAMGNFKLEPAPPGRFFVHIDGRTVVDDAAGIHYPDKSYYPFVGKAWEATAGRTDNLAGGTGKIYLPLITAGTLQPVSLTSDTTISFPPSVVASNPALAGVSITVPANSLFNDNGTRGGMVGIAPVPPDRLPGPLPPGLEPPIVITVQTDGALNFDKPAPICFPNLPDPVTGKALAAGSKQALISFNHKKGIWEAVGDMTVSADGKMICTDPGSGILQPGWHGVGPQPDGPPPPCKNCCPISGGAGPQSLLPSKRGNVVQRLMEPGEGNAGCDVCRPNNSELQDCLDRIDMRYKDCIEASARLLRSRIKDCIINNITSPSRAWECIKSSFARSSEEKAQCDDDKRFLKGECKNCYSPFSPPSPAPESPPVGRRSRPLGLQGLSPEDQILVLLDEAENILLPYLGSNTAPQGPLAQALALFDQADAIGGGDAAGYLEASQRSREELGRSPHLPPRDANNPPDYGILYAAEVLRPGGSLVLRSETGPFGQYSLFVPRDGQLLNVIFYDPRTKRSAMVFPNLRADAPYRLPDLTLVPFSNSSADDDHDGLPNIAEFVYGTDPNNPDTDGDGIRDGAEVDQGTNPLDGRPAQTGIIATAKTPGSAVDICAANDLIVTAEGTAGISIFNAYDGENPTIIAHVSTPGNAQRVASDGNVIAVAQPDVGLSIIDVSTPASTRIIQQVRLSGAQAVAVSAGRIFAGTDAGVIVSVDSASGALMSRVSLTNAVWDLALSGNYLYALTDDRLFAFSGSDNSPILTGSVPSPFPNSPFPVHSERRLFVGGGIGYGVHHLGYNTFDLSVPASPALIKPGSTTQFGWKQIVPNGSGLGLAAVGPNSGFNVSQDVSLYNLSSPTNTDVFITKFPTPGDAQAVAIWNGLGYVADGAAGLEVINYLAYDNASVPPQITLVPGFNTNGVQAGARVYVNANATDNVQVRNVEFYLDGAKVFSDGNFPFEYRFAAPAFTTAKTNFTLRARAIDTGGNATWSDTITISLLPDTTAPTVIGTTPFVGGAKTLTTVLAYFSKPINSATLTSASFQLFAAGPDGTTGTSDDIPVSSGIVSYIAAENAAALTFAARLPEARYRAVLTTAITDLAGNHLATAHTWDFQVADAIFWINQGNGAWADSANWEGGVVPTLADNVVINFPVTVFLPNGITLSKTVSGIPGASLYLFAGPAVAATFDGLTLDTDIFIEGNAKVRVINGLTANGKITMNGGINLTQLNFDGAQTFDGAGQVIFTDPNNRTTMIQPINGALTIGPSLTIRGSGAVGQPNLPLINQGTILGENGQTMRVLGSVVTNAGTLDASTGGISVINLQNTGVLLAAGGTFALDGAWQNAGAFALTNSTVNVNGNYSQASLGTINSSNITVLLNGTFDNRNNILTLDASKAGWQFNTVAILGGTIQGAGGVALTVPAYGTPTLDGVVLNADLVVGDSADIKVVNGLTFNGTCTLYGGINTTSLNFDGTQTLDGQCQINLAGPYDPVLHSINGTLTVGPKVTIVGGYGIVGRSDLPLINQGTIRCENSNRAVQVVGSSVINSGSVIAFSGPITIDNLQNHGVISVSTNGTLTLTGAWTNSGTISVSSGTMNVGGTYAKADFTAIQRHGGTINFNSVLDNRNSTLTLDNNSDSWNLVGGTILGGTLNTAAGAHLGLPSFAIGKLDGMIFNGDIALTTGSKLTITNGLTLNGRVMLADYNPTVSLDGTQTLDGAGKIVYVGTDTGTPRTVASTGGTLTISASFSIEGGSGSLGNSNLPLVNLGRITADGVGSVITIHASTFTNTGTLQELHGGKIVIAP